MGSAQDFFQISVMELEDLAHVLKRILQMCLGSLFTTIGWTQIDQPVGVNRACTRKQGLNICEYAAHTFPVPRVCCHEVLFQIE